MKEIQLETNIKSILKEIVSYDTSKPIGFEWKSMIFLFLIQKRIYSSMIFFNNSKFLLSCFIESAL